MLTAPLPVQHPDVLFNSGGLTALEYEAGPAGYPSQQDVSASINIVTAPTRQQRGRALEVLGRAVEYLVDSRMFLIDQVTTRADAEALEILMRLSRQVFEDRPEVLVPAGRLRLWLSNRLASN